MSRAKQTVAALKLHAELHPDVTLLDVRLPEVDGFEILERIRTTDPKARILILAASALSHEIARARDLGARGYLPKHATRQQLTSAIRRVHAGKESWDVAREHPQPLLDVLSRRELEVLDCVRRGLTNPDIALALGISEHTAKNHVKAILQKLGAAHRAEAVARGFELGLLS